MELEYTIIFFLCWIISSIVVSIFEREARIDIVFIACAMALFWPVAVIAIIIFLMCKFVMFSLKHINEYLAIKQLGKFRNANLPDNQGRS